MNICLLMMGGSGIRFGADRPKQFITIKSKPIFAYILDGLNQSEHIDKIIVVAHGEWLDFVEEWKERINAYKVYKIISGGSTRSESVKNGLIAAAEIANDSDIVLIHDATHPYVDIKSMGEIVKAVKKYGAATMVQRQYDTCYCIDENDMITSVTPRQFVVSGASPEAFMFGDIYKIYINASRNELDLMTSAGAIALAHGIQMKVITLQTINLKITYPRDMEILEQIPEFFFT